MILARYLGSQLLRGYCLVLLVLLALFCFLDLVDELSEVGKGQYRIVDAFLYVFSTVPTKLLEFSPVCLLIGGAYMLAGLARGSELLAMRAAGMSVAQIALAQLQAVLVLALGLVVVAQFIAPPSRQWGVIHRQQALAGTDSIRTEQGFWSRDRHRFMSIASLLHGRLPVGINIYEFAENGLLLQFVHAERADIQADGSWLLQAVTVKRWHGKVLKTEFESQRLWQPFLTEKQLKILELPPETLSLSDLWGYVRHLRASGQQAANYALLFWQRVLLPLNLAVMIPFLIPLVLVSHRMQRFGWQIAFSILVGVLYYLVAQVSANAGLLLDLPPLWIALTPTAIILLLTAGIRWVGLHR